MPALSTTNHLTQPRSQDLQKRITDTGRDQEAENRKLLPSPAFSGTPQPSGLPAPTPPGEARPRLPAPGTTHLAARRPKQGTRDGGGEQFAPHLFSFAPLRTSLVDLTQEYSAMPDYGKQRPTSGHALPGGRRPWRDKHRPGAFRRLRARAPCLCVGR